MVLHKLSVVLLALMASICKAQLPHEMFTQSGEHFNEIVAATDGTGKIERNAVLVMQETSCILRVEYRGLPNANNLVFVVYMKDQSMDNIWWKKSPQRDDLKTRYSNGDCNEVLFFKKGTNLNDKPIRWEAENVDDLLDWVWEQVKVEVVLVNKYKDTLAITQRWIEYSPIHPRFEWIYPDETITIETYPGYHVLVNKQSRDGQMVYGFLVKDQKRLVIDEFTPLPNWENLMNNDNDAASYRNQWLFSQTMRTLLNMKQPMFTQGFTENGYEVKNIPESVLDNLMTHYKEDRPKRIDEPIYPSEMHIINKDEEKPGLIEVPGELVSKIASALDTSLEEFCSCKLDFSSAYGIHEFYKGHVVRRHVTEVSGNVIAATMVLDETRDNTTTPWKFEVTAMDGVRRKLDVRPGQMVIYESARIIHGFPEKYEGRRFAVFSVYFRPAAGWDYYISNDYIVNGRTGQQEHIFATDTELLNDSKNFLRKDEL